jgi:hypothetical protein
VFSNFPIEEKLLRDILAKQVCHVMETPGVFEFYAKYENVSMSFEIAKSITAGLENHLLTSRCFPSEFAKFFVVQCGKLIWR